MINKYFRIAVLIALTAFLGSCQKEFMSWLSGNVEVSLKVETGAAMTRAIADGTNIDILHYEIYGTDVERASVPLAEGSVKDSDGDGVFDLDLTLIKDQTYNFIFWAQVDREQGMEHYDVSDLRKVGIKSYADELANDESRAAFFAHKEIHVSGSIDETITLYRPFAQLNIGTVTYDTSLNLAGDLAVNTSEVNVTGIASVFNTISGKGEGKQKVTFQAAAPHVDMSASERKLEVNGARYHWLGMNYMIVNGDADNVTVDVLFDTTYGDVSLSVENVPVRENYRTNIIGDLLTTDAKFVVVVDDRFAGADIIVE